MIWSKFIDIGFFWFFFPLNIFWRTRVLFVGPLIPLFWTSGDICPGFQSQVGVACTLSSLLAILRFTSEYGSPSRSLHAELWLRRGRMPGCEWGISRSVHRRAIHLATATGHVFVRNLCGVMCHLGLRKFLT